jgi:hypothetical protein
VIISRLDRISFKTVAREGTESKNISSTTGGNRTFVDKVERLK